MNYIEKIDKIDKVIDRLIDKIIIYCIKREEREKKELKIFLFSLRTMDLFVDGSCEISLLRRVATIAKTIAKWQHDLGATLSKRATRDQSSIGDGEFLNTTTTPKWDGRVRSTSARM